MCVCYQVKAFVGVLLGNVVCVTYRAIFHSFNVDFRFHDDSDCDVCTILM